MGDEKNIKYIIGIDEVGRGPIAGPVAVGAFMLPIKNYESFCLSATSPTCGGKLSKLRDSKKLSKKQREEWFGFLKKQKEEGSCDFVVSFVSSEMIDKFGIAKCIQKALDESLYKITLSKEHTSTFCIFLDGGLHAKKEFVNQETIIKGDELHPIISLASIVAKVSRDKVMENFSKKYKEYGFEKHSGYGTRAHYEAIKTHGQTPIHRKTFIR